MVKITNKTRRTTFTTSSSSTTTSLRIFFRSHLNKCICISPFILLSFVIFVIVIILKLQNEHKLIIKQQQQHQQQQQQQQYHYDNIIDNDVVNIHNHNIIISNNHISNNEQKIINGELHLINLNKPTFYHMDNKTTSTTTTNNNNNNNNQRPYSVIGTFCHLDWTLHKENPSNVPMNKDLIHKSKECHGTSMIQMDVYDIVQKMKQFDLVSLSTLSSQNNNNKNVIHTMEPTGFVFHESRCGSTLVANSLASYNPETNRVYSESNPPITAAKAFNEQYEESSLQLLRDVLYLMGKIYKVYYVLL